MADRQISQQDAYGITFVACAAASGNTEALKSFIIRNADITIPDNCGNTPLDIARMHQHLKTVEFLSIATRARETGEQDELIRYMRYIDTCPTVEKMAIAEKLAIFDSEEKITFIGGSGLYDNDTAGTA